jgi:hypothetical protein
LLTVAHFNSGITLTSKLCINLLTTRALQSEVTGLVTQGTHNNGLSLSNLINSTLLNLNLTTSGLATDLDSLAE